MKTCAKCQALCEDHMKFCLNCGEPFPEETILTEAKEETIPELVLEPAAEPVETPEAVETAVPAAEPVAEPVKPAVDPAEIKPAVDPAAVAAAAAQPALSKAEQKAAEKEEKAIEKEAEKEARKREAAELKAQKAAQKQAEKAMALRKKAAGRQPMSVLAVLAIIFGIIGIFAGGYACLLSFMNLGIALCFYIPALLGIIFGFLALRNTGKGMLYRGRPLAFLGLIIGAVAIVLWIIGTFLLRHYTAVEFGSMDLMSAIRTIITKV